MKKKNLLESDLQILDRTSLHEPHENKKIKKKLKKNHGNEN